MKRFTWLKKMAVGALLLAPFCTAPARADVILIDFGTVAKRQSVGAADSNGNWWNQVTGKNDVLSSMITSANGATTVGLTISDIAGGGTGDYNAGLTPNAGLDGGKFAYTNVTDDALFWTATDTPTLNFTGLNDSLTYSFTFYGSRVSANERYTTYQIGAQSAELHTSGSTLPSSWNSSSVVTISGVTSSGGAVNVDMSGFTGAGKTGAATFGYLNALQITSVPEPSSALFLVLGAPALLGARRWARRRMT